MSALETGKQLVDLCRRGQFMDAVDTLYARNIVSIEPQGAPGMPAKMEGIAAIRGKNQWWTENHEVHAMQVEGPFVGPQKAREMKGPPGPAKAEPHALVEADAARLFDMTEQELGVRFA